MMSFLRLYMRNGKFRSIDTIQLSTSSTNLIVPARLGSVGSTLLIILLLKMYSIVTSD